MLLNKGGAYGAIHFDSTVKEGTVSKWKEEKVGQSQEVKVCHKKLQFKDCTAVTTLALIQNY